MNTVPALKILTSEERKSTFACSHHHKSESLDWKKIASVDIQKLIQTANIELLEELLTQIAYCRPEIEFDSLNSDSGFIKVFKLSQLILGYFYHSRQVIEDKYQKLDQQHVQAETELAAQAKQIENLKETLTAAKKELRRRKELLASAQSEVVGDNRDEYDPCPYCSKKFLTSAYLISHMQRRHQGLPLHPVLPGVVYQGHAAARYIENDYFKHQSQLSPGQPPHSITNQIKMVQSTQTENSFPLPSDPVSAEVFVKELVETYLKEKSNMNKDDVQKTAVESTTEKAEVDDESTEKKNENIKSRNNSCSPDNALEYDAGESVKNIMAEIKQQLDLQWQYFSGRIQDSSIEEMKSQVVIEPTPENMRAIKIIPSPVQCSMQLLKTNIAIQTEEAVPVVPVSASPSKEPQQANEIDVTARFQQQQKDLENLQLHLQSKMEADIKIIEGKLEAQERFWRSKLRNVQEEYSLQMAKLRQDFYSSMPNQPQNNLNSSQPGTWETQSTSNNEDRITQGLLTTASSPHKSLSSNHPREPETGNESKSRIHFEKPVTQPVLPATAEPTIEPPLSAPAGYRATETIMSLSGIAAAAVALDNVPKATEMPVAIRHQHPNTLNKPVAKPRSIFVANQEERINSEHIIAATSIHDCEEPNHLVETNQVKEYSEVSDSASSDEDMSDQIEVGGSETPKLGGNVGKGSWEEEEEEEQEKIANIRTQVFQELSSHLHALGLTAEGTVVDENKMVEVAQRLQSRRESIQRSLSNFEEVQEYVNQTTELKAQEKRIQDRYAAFTAVTSTPEKVTRSPLVKMFSAVKVTGKRMHKRVKSAIHKKPKLGKSSPTVVAPGKASSSKAGFFSRERWSGKKQRSEKAPEENAPKAVEEGSSSSSDSEATSSEPDVQVHYIPKDKSMLTSTPLKVQAQLKAQPFGSDQHMEATDSSDYETENEEHSLQPTTSPPVKKLIVKNNKASKLRYLEATRKTNARKTNTAEYQSERRNSVNPPAAAVNGSKKSNNEPNSSRPVRRSLKFDEASPVKTAAATAAGTESDEETTGDEISSSWDENPRKGNEKPGERVRLPPSKDTLERFPPSSFPEHVVVPKEIKIGQKGLGYPMMVGKQDELDDLPPQEFVRRVPTATARLKSARPRIATDSWDIDEDEASSPRPQPVTKPRISSQRWNPKPPVPQVYESTKQPAPLASVSQHNKNKKGGRDSPLNNSWDSN